MTTCCLADLAVTVHWKSVMDQHGNWHRIPIIVSNPPSDPKALRRVLAENERVK